MNANSSSSCPAAGTRHAPAPLVAAHSAATHLAAAHFAAAHFAAAHFAAAHFAAAHHATAARLAPRSAMFLGLLLGFGASLPSHASETSIEERIGRIDEGKVHLTFASRPGVYGNGRNITTTEPGDDWEPSPDMERGPVRVLLRYRDSEVVEVETYVGGRWREDTGARDLGSVPVPAATEFLLGLARHGGHARAAADAIFPATLGEGAAPWEELLAIAKLESRPREVRESALFWLGQAAGEKISAQLAGFVEDPLEDLELREHAVFVLSQRPDVESLPALLRIARSHPSPGVRRAALFWLGQKEDPRVYQLLEEILLGS